MEDIYLIRAFEFHKCNKNVIEKGWRKGMALSERLNEMLPNQEILFAANDMSSRETANCLCQYLENRQVVPEIFDWIANGECTARLLDRFRKQKEKSIVAIGDETLTDYFTRFYFEKELGIRLEKIIESKRGGIVHIMPDKKGYDLIEF